MRWLRQFGGKRRGRQSDIADELWHQTLMQFPFLSLSDTTALRQMTREFLDTKEFHGANGLEITDAIAIAIAAQACLPVLHLQLPLAGITWYDDFVGIVVHPGSVLARREVADEVGIVHQYAEVLSGEAMQDGPVTLSWHDVAGSGATAADGYNVVIHEFAHKIDMRDGMADGCPPLYAGFMGAPHAKAARVAWMTTLEQEYQGLCDRLSLAERFGGEPVWLDSYGATSKDEFFAVASEAYFVNRPRFAAECPGLLPMFDAFFIPAG